MPIYNSLKMGCVVTSLTRKFKYILNLTLK